MSNESKKQNMRGSGPDAGSAGLLDSLCDCIADAIEGLKDCQADQHIALITQLEALLSAIQEGNACLLYTSPSPRDRG